MRLPRLHRIGRRRLLCLSGLSNSSLKSALKGSKAMPIGKLTPASKPASMRLVFRAIRPRWTWGQYLMPYRKSWPKVYRVLEVLQKPTETAGNELCQRAATALSHGWFNDALRDAVASVKKFPY